ncbi:MULTISPECIES: DUF5606 domain-containing protein [Porphyromonas]|uniref:DUF5606 domain-containing protein n=1 Tax=Porphyromonas canoris TaxID=36875 RepID=A0ABR4XLH3_9PORP|nr:MULTISPECIES: DUF5606 domain-containing protein [Porphyromonas]KGL53100.1 hypothetical protein HQ29_03090 [Porphyromonas canoris]KGN69232.1 hypothetical protein JT26_05455 [Porphyromonas sp. COT-108 OH1349]KGN92538.1 hypothetical protein HQ43_04620 [Porphyromonas canoris]
MSLKQILSISGKPGLFKILTGNRTPIVIQDLTTKVKRQLFPKDKVVSLYDISIYTEEGDLPLRTLLTTIFEKQSGKELDAENIAATPESLKSFMEEVLPSYDKERVYPTDIRKVVLWYNTLVKDGFTTFEEQEEEKEA